MSVTRTLFSPDDWRPRARRDRGMPYTLVLHGLCNNEDERFDISELCAFSQTVEHEANLIELRGFIAGPIVFEVNGETTDCLEKPISIPGYVESEGTSFLSHSATGVLLVENSRIFDELANAGLCSALSVILVSATGIPRVNCRRLLSRLERELGLPVHMLMDNDTWGYFVFSMMARGMLGPHMTSKPHALRNPRFLGIRAGEAAKLGISSKVLRPPKPSWKLRMAEMRRYECFRNSIWEKEFDEFEPQAGGVDVRLVIAEMGTKEFIENYLAPRLARESQAFERGDDRL